jgi:hypothetical protein
LQENIGEDANERGVHVTMGITDEIYVS